MALIPRSKCGGSHTRVGGLASRLGVVADHPKRWVSARVSAHWRRARPTGSLRSYPAGMRSENAPTSVAAAVVSVAGAAAERMRRYLIGFFLDKATNRRS